MVLSSFTFMKEVDWDDSNKGLKLLPKVFLLLFALCCLPFVPPFSRLLLNT